MLSPVQKIIYIYTPLKGPFQGVHTGFTGDTKFVKMKKQQKINEAMRLVDNSYALKKNTVRINTHNSLIHEVCKLIKTYELIKDGNEVYTEVIFKNKARADIFIPFKFQVIEVLHTETEEKAKTKKEYYPSKLYIIFLKTTEILNILKEAIKKWK